MVLGRQSAIFGVLAGSLSGPEATRRVALVSAGLGLLGVVLLIATVWWWRSTRAEHPSLGPLEVMSARRWRRANDAEQTRLVERARPSGADRAPGWEPEPVDLSVLATGHHAGFDDLREIDVMLGLQLPGSLALGTQPSAVDLAALRGEDLDDDDGLAVPQMAPEAGSSAATVVGDAVGQPVAGHDPSDRNDQDEADEDLADEDLDPTVAIDGGDVASLLVREAVHEHERHVRLDEGRTGLADLGDLSVAEAHDLDLVTEVDERDGAGDDDDESIDPLLQRTANPD